MTLTSQRVLAMALIGGLLAAGPAYAKKKKEAPAPADAPAAAAPAAPAGGDQPSVQTNAPAPSPQSNKLALVPTQKDWTKVCGKDQSAGKQVCYTTRDFSAEAGKPPVLALAVYDIQGEDAKVVRMLMPVGLMLRPGFRFVVDGGAPTDGAYEICFPNGCFAEAKIKTANVDAMKTGKEMDVSVRNQGNSEVVFAVPLEGFGKSYDGPAIDPKVLQDQQQKLQAELQKRAEDERKKLEADKAAAGSTAGSSTGGAALPGAK